MTKKQREQICLLKAQGLSSRKIAETVCVPLGTVKSYISRHKESVNGDSVQEVNLCVCCGKPLPPSTGSRPKRFCDRRCYIRWWYAQDGHNRTEYSRNCEVCGTPFTVKSVKTQRFCSAACFQIARKAGKTSTNHQIL